MIGWLLILSFVLGFVLMWIATVRSVSRTVEPVRQRRLVREIHVDADEGGRDGHGSSGRPREERGSSPALARRRAAVPQVVEFEDDDDIYRP